MCNFVQMRYIIVLSYDGSAFSGWQVQNNAPSVQGTLQDALAMLTGAPAPVTGAGRTDTGVNARNYVAHFDTEALIEDTAKLTHRLNAVLPRQIAVHSIQAAPEDFHARFSATSRQYKYYINRAKDPFTSAYSWHCRYPLDINRMNKACEYLIGTHDCTCFEKKGSDNATSICTITAAGWEYETCESEAYAAADAKASRLVFTVSANRFLRNMVRAIVGTMVDIGRGVHEPEYILEILDHGTRGDAGQSVPGNALFLTKIEY